MLTDEEKILIVDRLIMTGASVRKGSLELTQSATAPLISILNKNTDEITDLKQGLVGVGSYLLKLYAEASGSSYGAEALKQELRHQEAEARRNG